MNHYLIEVALNFKDATAEDIEPIFDVLADVVADITEDDYGYVDGDVGFSGSEARIEISFNLADDDDDRAYLRGMAAARTAIHTAGGPTPGWEKIITLSQQRELTSM